MKMVKMPDGKIKPLYKIKHLCSGWRVTLINGDCLEVMPTLADLVRINKEVR